MHLLNTHCRLLAWPQGSPRPSTAHNTKHTSLGHRESPACSCRPSRMLCPREPRAARAQQSITLGSWWRRAVALKNRAEGEKLSVIYPCTKRCCPSREPDGGQTWYAQVENKMRKTSLKETAELYQTPWSHTGKNKNTFMPITVMASKRISIRKGKMDHKKRFFSPDFNGYINSYGSSPSADHPNPTLAAGSWHVPAFVTAAPDSEAFLPQEQLRPTSPFSGCWHIPGVCSQLTCPDPSSTSLCIPALKNPPLPCTQSVSILFGGTLL